MVLDAGPVPHAYVVRLNVTMDKTGRVNLLEWDQDLTDHIEGNERFLVHGHMLVKLGFHEGLNRLTAEFHLHLSNFLRVSKANYLRDARDAFDELEVVDVYLF